MKPWVRIIFLIIYLCWSSKLRSPSLGVTIEFLAVTHVKSNIAGGTPTTVNPNGVRVILR